MYNRETIVDMLSEWYPLKEYEGLYEITRTGQVRTTGNCNSVNYKGKIIILNPSTTPSGYKRLGLMKNGKRTYHSIHRLVALTFIPNPENKPCVNHKNGIKHDNRVKNLEWNTISENAIHAFRVLKRKPSMLGRTYHNNHKAKKVICIETSQIFSSLREAAESVDGKSGNISLCCQNKKKSYKKLHWKYL